MKKSKILMVGVLACALFAACSDKDTSTAGAAFDPSKPIVVDDFYPDSGGVATSMIISGSNFGTDTVGLRVMYVDEDGIEHRGGLVSSNGEKIYCTVPKGLTYKRNIGIKVMRGEGEKAISGEAPNKFIYRTQTAVTTVIGQPNSENQATVPGTLTSTTLSAPAYICLDDEDNIFICERTHYTGRADGCQARNSKNENKDGNVLIASLKRNNVRFLGEDCGFVNAPAFSDESGVEAMYAPLDGGMDFYRYQKATNFAQQKLRVIKTEETKTLDEKNWKFCFVVNKKDHQLYTVMHQGQLVRINPKTRKTTILLKKIGIHGASNNGSDSFFAFSPTMPNRLFICQTDNNEIWYVDIDQLEGKDPNEYHGEKYAGCACWEGTSAGRGWEDGLLKNAKFNYPRQICFTADGKMYIADSMNSCIRCIDTNQPDNKATVTTVIGLPGSAGFKEGGPDVAQFRYPRGVAVNADGSIVYVADTGNRCIRKLTIE